MTLLRLPLMRRRLARRIFPFVAATFFPLFVFGQRMVVAESGVAPVAIDALDVSTEITGRMAVTTFDLTFRNPNGRPLEGTFEFPLLEGQSVIRFALDIEGALREAVPIEKERGRVVFEEIQRRRVDPGLLEQTAGNNYRARVFPLPANGTRRVVIAYQEDLGRAARGAAYRLALDAPGKISRFRLSARVHGGGVAAAVARTTLPLTLPDWETTRGLSVERTDFAAKGVLEVDLPRIDQPAAITERRGEREYFYGEVPVAGFAAAPRPAPRVVGLLWDASGSARERDRAKEFAALEAWFAEVRDVEVRLIFLRDRASAAKTFTVREGRWSELRGALKNAVHDGASSFDGVSDDASVQEWLLFSDGLINYGTTIDAARLPLKAPVHAVVASAQADPVRLRALANRHGGEFVNLLETDAAAAVRRLRGRSCRVLAVERDAEEVGEIFPEVGAVVDDSFLIVTGVLRKAEATIRLKIGTSEADAREVEFVVRSGVAPGGLAARAWASAKIAALSADPSSNRADLRRTSREFGIVTADTSLIVLETLEDYVRYEIAPPEELRAAWAANRRMRDDGFQKERATHLDTVFMQFAEKQAWWKTKFPKEADRAGDAKAGGVGASAGAVAGAGRGRRVPPALSVPAGDAFGGGAAGDDEVVVLSAFEVTSARSGGNAAGSSMAGSRSDRRTTRRVRAEAAQTGGGGSGAGNARAVRDAADVVTLKPWSSDAGYLDRLQRTWKAERHAVYLEERADHGAEAGFYLDVGDFFLREGDAETGLRILSNLAELALEDAALLRALGHRLVQAGRSELALPLFERVLRIRGEEPQSRRDLALVCAALKQHQRAIDLLWEVVAQPWNGRFPGVELIALGELNAIAATCGGEVDLSKVERRFRENLPVGLRAVLTWDADSCDIDLWIDDPAGERAYYRRSRTGQGGRMSADFTGGYGPEEFLLREPKPGKYTARINYYGDSRQAVVGPVTAQVRLITGFGTAQQKEQILTVRLAAKSEVLEIGTITIGAAR